ncbi:MAG: hypothetical protein D4R67_07660 [Bacteroidetes bacterium]|nr:MAG: hypothetical protein D4R67_07660 [Bacteroidota bacterium]
MADKQQEKAIFRLLKKEVATAMQHSYPAISPDISEWKGKEIVDFQEEMASRVSGQISEKWFYTHMKTDSGSLPRIDVLNLLSRFCGYTGWDDFCHRNSSLSRSDTPLRKANRVFLVIPLLVIAILAILFVVFKLYNTLEYRICFYDADTREPITNNIIEVSLLLPGESPVNFLCSADGCLVLKTDQTMVTLVVKTPYYQPDTVVRVLDRFKREEMVRLRPNNYALMIHYFSRMNVKDWQQRRNQLDRMLSDSALIYQVYNTGAVGMELFSKWEFINKLTMPASSLNQIEILDTKYMKDRIVVLRFRQKPDRP